MQNLPNKTLVFFIAMLFFTSVSAEELLHDHHEHHHISVEIDCDFCVNSTPEFDNKIVTFEGQFHTVSKFIQTLDKQFIENNIVKFYSRGPPQI